MTIHLYVGKHKKNLGKRREPRISNNGVERQNMGRAKEGMAFEPPKKGKSERKLRKQRSGFCSFKPTPEANVLRHGVYGGTPSWKMEDGFYLIF